MVVKMDIETENIKGIEIKIKREVFGTIGFRTDTLSCGCERLFIASLSKVDGKNPKWTFCEKHSKDKTELKRIYKADDFYGY